MLLHPKPLVSANHIGKESQTVIDPWITLTSNCTMVRVVLDVHANQCLGHSVRNCELPRRRIAVIDDPQVCEIDKGSDVEKAAQAKARCRVFAAPRDNLEDFTLDVALKISIKLVSADKRELCERDSFADE